jgi:hypothetical protein
MDQLASYISVGVGDKLKVYYGPTHESKVTYEAKVGLQDISTLLRALSIVYANEVGIPGCLQLCAGLNHHFTLTLSVQLSSFLAFCSFFKLTLWSDSSMSCNSPNDGLY